MALYKPRKKESQCDFLFQKSPHLKEIYKIIGINKKTRKQGRSSTPAAIRCISSYKHTEYIAMTDVQGVNVH